MPESGVPCEYYSKKKNVWVPVTPRSSLDFLTLFDREKGAICLNVSLHKFRPLKIKQDIEREEAIEKMKKIAEISVGGGMARLYDAGYRKVGNEVSKDDLRATLSGIQHNKVELMLIHMNANFKIFYKAQS